MEQQQGTIRYNAAINSLYKSDKGKELLAYNLENSSLVGIAITPNMVNDLNSKFTFINLMKKRLNEENKEKKGWEPLPLINFSTQVNPDDNVPKYLGNKPNVEGWQNHPLLTIILKIMNMMKKLEHIRGKLIKMKKLFLILQ